MSAHCRRLPGGRYHSTLAREPFNESAADQHPASPPLPPPFRTQPRVCFGSSWFPRSSRCSSDRASSVSRSSCGVEGEVKGALPMDKRVKVNGVWLST